MSFKVRDPVHNFISLRKQEVQLLDTLALQRLRGISQLAMANLVYPGAVHTRFDHSLGVTHVAGLMAKELDLKEDEGEVRLVRLAALVHDIGHGPFSHVSEHALERYADRAKLHKDQKKEKIHELITARIIKTDGEIIKTLGKDTCQEITNLLSEGHGQPVLKSIVSGPLDADKQDYLLRDSFFCGVPYGIFDMHQLHRSLALKGSDDEKQLMIKRDGIHAVEQYVLAKYYLTTSVYRHKVRLITDQMIIRAITLGIDKDRIETLYYLYRFDNSDAFVENYIHWDDARFMQEFCINGIDSKCKELLDRLRARRLLKQVFEADINVDEFRSEVSDMLLNLSKPEYENLRSEIEKAISEKLSDLMGQEVDPDFVIIHAFSIRSVREMSRNDEGGILVVGDYEPEPFIEASTLFASINERYADEFVEVYAPIEWKTPTDKSSIRRRAKEPIKEMIETKCLESMKGAPK